MTDQRIPLLIVGDAPGQPSGLARILNDLAIHINADCQSFDVRTCGYMPWSNLGQSGMETATFDEFGNLRRWVFSDLTDWGATAVNRCYRTWWGDRPGILFTIWDPARCHAFRVLPLPVWRVGYFPIDGENIHGKISGPAAQALDRYHRILAYTKYGAGVLARTMNLPEKSFKDLPHGVDGKVFRDGYARPQAFETIPEGRQVIGTVATNQPRKDWATAAAAIRQLLDWGKDVHWWAHVDRPVGEAWSLPQLVEDFGLETRVTMTTSLSDEELAACYANCVMTFANGLGGGWEFPITESLCCGTPAIHVRYAGGAEQLPDDWLIECRDYQLVGPYAIQRPILNHRKVAELLDQGLTAKPQLIRGAALMAGRSYHWQHIWPLWADEVRRWPRMFQDWDKSRQSFVPGGGKS